MQGEVMLKRIQKIEDRVYSVKLRDNLYSLVQHRREYFYEFFDIFFTEPEKNIFLPTDLNNLNILMTLCCAHSRLKDFFLRVEKNVIPNRRPMQDKFLSSTHMMMVHLANGTKGKKPSEVSLIKVPDVLKFLSYEVIIQELDEDRDKEAICLYEFSGMWGDSEELKNKLIRYVETGVLWGKDKEFFFPNTEPVKKEKPVIYPFSELVGIR